MLSHSSHHRPSNLNTNLWYWYVFMFGISKFAKGRSFILPFYYLNSIYWTRCIIGTVLVHQRAIGKHHGMPQIGIGFTKWDVQERLCKRDRDILTRCGEYLFSICKQFLCLLALTYFSHLNQLRNSLEMVYRQQKGFQTFFHRHIASLEPNFQELQDPGITDLNNHVQKPTSNR